MNPDLDRLHPYPFENHDRMALVAPLDECVEAAERIRDWWKRRT